MANQHRINNEPDRDELPGEETPESDREENCDQKWEEGRKGANQDWLELGFSLLSGLAILAVVGYLIWQGVQEERPTAFELRAGPARKAGEMFHVPVTVRNSGDEAAQQVEVSVKLKGPGDEESEGRATIDWLPGHSVRTAVAVVKQDPREGELEVLVEGYQAP